MCKVDSKVSDEYGTQCRVVIALPTGHSTVRKHLDLMKLTNISLCRRCETEEQTSAHSLCEFQSLASLITGLLVLGPRGYLEYKSGVLLKL